MDIGGQHSDDEIGFEDAEEEPRHRALPSDLPKSLDDRQPIRHYAGETEMYDAWQGNFDPQSYELPERHDRSYINQVNRNSLLVQYLPNRLLSISLWMTIGTTTMLRNDLRTTIPD